MKKLILTSVLLFCVAAIKAEINKVDKQALIDLYISTNGDNWNQTWDLSDPVETWAGISTENGRVTGISLLFNKITGTIPASIGDLSELRVLELSFNEISGSLPSSIGNLKKLEILAFNGNDLTGNIPVSFGGLAHLKQLHLSSNKLTGTLPSTLSALHEIEIFNVFDNDFVGELPISPMNNPNLKELIIAENEFRNTEKFSRILLSNSGSKLNLSNEPSKPESNSIIAREINDDEND